MSDKQSLFISHVADSIFCYYYYSYYCYRCYCYGYRYYACNRREGPKQGCRIIRSRKSTYPGDRTPTGDALFSYATARVRRLIENQLYVGHNDLSCTKCLRALIIAASES